MISAAILYKFRHQSYDWDWLDALEAAFDARMIDVRRSPPADPIYDADVVIIHHSVFATEKSGLPLWARTALNMRRGRLVIFYTNEFRLFAERRRFAEDVGADYVCTQLCWNDAIGYYGDLGLGLAPYRLLELPAAVNPDAFRVAVPRAERKYHVGYRGTLYPKEVGDRDRNITIECLANMEVLKPGTLVDAKWGNESLVYRPDWAALLNSWRATVSTESGMAGLKCLASRHMDAIGCGTVNVMLKGEYNGILRAEEHYVPFELGAKPTDTLNNMHAAVMRAQGEDEMARRAREYVCDEHTYRHRVAALMAALEGSSANSQRAFVVDAGGDPEGTVMLRHVGRIV